MTWEPYSAFGSVLEPPRALPDGPSLEPICHSGLIPLYPTSGMLALVVLEPVLQAS